jgi:DNA-binding winged helix-turn-helix (wHTH) protein/tetratricopeptide (TPR) repeat protein
VRHTGCNIAGGDEIFYFGPYEIHLRACELRKSGRRVKLQDQPLRLLLCLLERRGEVITREELRQRLWSADTFVDFDTGLNAAIRKLRRVLGDAPGGRSYVETVPRRGYRFLAADELPGSARAKVDSLAVLPFTTTDEGPDAEYFCEGMTEALIAAISELPGMRKVIARNSVYRYKGRDPQQAGRELGVHAVLIGSVSVKDNIVTVTAELLDTARGTRLWGGLQEHQIAALPAVSREIAGELFAKLRMKLRKAKKRAPAARAGNFQAYRLFLRGRYFWNKRPAAGCVDKAIELFKDAIALDPSFAPAYAGLADSYNTLGAWEAGAMAPNVAFRLGKDAATRALQLDPTLAEAHTSLGYSRLHFDWDWPAAEAEFAHAISVNPNYSHAHHWYSHLLMATGRNDDALQHSLRIIELDPLDLIINVHLAWHYQMAGQFLAALDESRKLVEMESSFHWGHFFVGLALEQMHDAGGAVAALEKSVDLSGGSTVMLSALGHAYAAAGARDRARNVLRQLEELSAHRYVSSYEIGLIHVALEEQNHALDCLEKAYGERSGWIPYLAVEPRLASLRGHPRFQQVVRRVGLRPRS